jgi:hypothetical protein
VTIYDPDGKVTSVFDEARVWVAGSWSARGEWIDLEEGGLLFHIEHEAPPPDAAEPEA